MIYRNNVERDTMMHISKNTLLITMEKFIIELHL